MKSSQPIDRIVLIDTRRQDLSVELVARIDEQGNLALEGVDRGEWVTEQTGDWDYEYWLKVTREWKDTVLLHLLRERFENDSEFRKWLDDKGIPSEFVSF